jgi:hypothetical protein
VIGTSGPDGAGLLPRSSDRRLRGGALPHPRARGGFHDGRGAPRLDPVGRYSTGRRQGRCRRTAHRVGARPRLARRCGGGRVQVGNSDRNGRQIVSAGGHDPPPPPQIRPPSTSTSGGSISTDLAVSTPWATTGSTSMWLLTPMPSSFASVETGGSTTRCSRPTRSYGSCRALDSPANPGDPFRTSCRTRTSSPRLHGHREELRRAHPAPGAVPTSSVQAAVRMVGVVRGQRRHALRLGGFFLEHRSDAVFGQTSYRTHFFDGNGPFHEGSTYEGGRGRRSAVHGSGEVHAGTERRRYSHQRWGASRRSR